MEARKTILESIFQSTPDAIIVTDPKGRVAYANRQVSALFQYDPDDLIGQPIEVLVPQRFRQAHQAHRTWYQGNPHTRQMGAGLDLYGLRKDGSEFPVDIMLSPLDVPEVDTGLILAVARDITERKQQEDKARQSTQMFERLFEQSPDGIVVADTRGLIVRANAQTERLFGYHRDELLGQPVEVLLPERFRSAHQQHRHGYMDRGPQVRPMGAGLPLFAMRKDGSEFPVDIMLSPIEGDSQVLVLAVVRDITERKRAQEHLEQFARQLERSNQELERFASVAAHDLQEPLRKVQAFGDRLFTRYTETLDDRGREYLERMQASVERMRTLINDLLMYSRVTSKANPFTAIDLTEVVQEVLTDLDGRIQEANARVDVGELPVLEADPVQMGQLFQNLISNALKFCRAGVAPVVTIRSKPLTRSGWAITVQDNGIGFEEQYADRIFEVFQRLHGRQEYEGTGMGLAICRKIVERHGGEITAQGVPGEGAVFTVALPMRQQQERVHS